jgi:hypothetical protein
MGYEGMKQRRKSIVPREASSLLEALDRLIELYYGARQAGGGEEMAGRAGELSRSDRASEGEQVTTAADKAAGVAQNSRAIARPNGVRACAFSAVAANQFPAS